MSFIIQSRARTRGPNGEQPVGGRTCDRLLAKDVHRRLPQAGAADPARCHRRRGLAGRRQLWRIEGCNLAIAEGRRSAALPGRAGDPSYGDYPLPRRDAAMDVPLRSFRSWFLRIECARCGRERYAAETHMTIAGLGDQRIGDLLARLRHDGCGG